MKRKIQYGLINITALLLVAILFVSTYCGQDGIWPDGSIYIWVMMFAVTGLVHGIKILRLYCALYGQDIPFREHVKQYCKVIPVSMLIPFKAGEVFRMYCYGYQMQNYLGGIIVILLDRFSDTLALITMVFFICLAEGTGFIPVFYIMLIFLMCITACYLLFPGMYRYWKKYFLKSKASKRNNTILEILEKMNKLYSEIAYLAKGRCAILYLMSVIAWAIEIGGLVIVGRMQADINTGEALSEYLISALWGTESLYLKQFIMVSVILLFILYLSVRGMGILRKKGGRHENYSVV